jgi:hypothetical protein
LIMMVDHDCFSEAGSARLPGASAKDWPSPIGASATTQMDAYRLALRQRARGATVALQALDMEGLLARGCALHGRLRGCEMAIICVQRY